MSFHAIVRKRLSPLTFVTLQIAGNKGKIRPNPGGVGGSNPRGGKYGEGRAAAVHSLPQPRHQVTLSRMVRGSAVSSSTAAPDAAFHTTHWSVVLAARDGHSSRAEEALGELCRTYWYPLYAYTRRRGNGPSEAEDLTQAFFARLLEKNFIGDLTPGLGRFRSFLLTALKHFLANEWDRVRSQKRGGGKALLSLDEDQAESRYRIEAVDHTTPESLFEQRWAWTVLEQVIARLRQEFVSSEKGELFDHLKVFLSAAKPPLNAYAAVAEKTGLKEGTVKVAVHRLRRRYGELLRAQIAQTVSDPSEVEDELRYLIQVLAR